MQRNRSCATMVKSEAAAVVTGAGTRFLPVSHAPSRFSAGRRE
jgi:hypothetical protein